ncbi:glycoside hydrolase family 31 protein [Zobellia galactanivorans]|uniref:TIM-barrel domain-containing protein n=1 Tax=Zobellia galactanivorans (strain DSM 12802 / CCUG 47099 / CIP 106680 / NCIMB 13871 / Dsij) TaxID=63186 RepID=UPI0026E1F9AA|nr:TIM-barrel domain-containing protein [Zobellia galactanivorans]MDO6809945.1 glycoside hydrolase family 31 protein [Zobellia galactanivorans]
MIKFFLPLTFLIVLLSCTNTEKPLSNDLVKANWQETLPGIWKTVINKGETYNFIDQAPVAPKVEAIKKLGNSGFPLDKSSIEIKVINGKTYISLPLKKEEQIYGLGLNFKSLDQVGKVKRLHVDHYNHRDDGRTHAPVPFYVSSLGYGVFINSAQYIDVYVGTGVKKDNPDAPKPRDRNTDPNWESNPYSNAVEILIPSDKAEILVFEGETPMKVVQRFNLFFGGGVIPPKWGLGFWQRTPTLYNNKEVMKEISDFKEKNFPLDVIGLEPGWHSKSYPCTFEWDAERFPNPSQFINQVDNESVKLNLWCNPYVSPSSSMYDKLMPLSGSHKVWGGIVPDLNMEEARNIYGDHIMKNQISLGISGFKVDEVDGFDYWLWPDVATFPSGVSAEQTRQTYGLKFMDMVTDLYRKQNTRTYGLARANNAGGVAMPYALYNDQYAHQDFIAGLANSGFNGVLWEPEVRESDSAEEWLRRMQTSCLSPMAMINAWGSGTKPWSFPEVYEACQEIAYLRMQLLPYLYSSFSRYYFEGFPPFRAMALEDSYNSERKLIKKELDHTDNPYQQALLKENLTQYMMGDNIMVAPMFTGMKEREVILPKGRWFNFYTGSFMGDGEVITVAPPVNQIPLFVRDGGIIPMIPPIRQTSEWKEGTPLTLRVYGNAPAEFILYDDDGKSYDFEKGKYTTKLLKADKGVGQIKDLQNNSSWTYGEIHWEFMTKTNVPIK